MNKEREYCVYKHTTPNGKVYIGQTCRQPDIRWANGFGYKHQMFYNAIQKYGWDNIKHEILFDKLSKEEADAKEIELISYYDTTNPEKGYNLAFGGVSTTGVKCSEETKAKISKANKGRKLSEESRRRISNSHKGHKSYESQRKATAEANHNRMWSEESKEKLRKANNGKKIPKEQIIKTQNTLRLQKENRLKNLRLPLETELIWIHELCPDTFGGRKCAHNSRSVLCVETGIIYHSSFEAQEHTGASRTSITCICNGDSVREFAGGYHWMFYEDYLKQINNTNNSEDNYGEAI